MQLNFYQQLKDVRIDDRRKSVRPKKVRPDEKKHEYWNKDTTPTNSLSFSYKTYIL